MKPMHLKRKRDSVWRRIGNSSMYNKQMIKYIILFGTNC